jgi:hypothetical protein
MQLAQAVNQHYLHWRGDPNDPVPAPAEEPELEAYVKSLSPGIVYLLLVIVLVGRGHYRPEKWLSAYQAVSDEFPNPRWAVEQLLEDPPYLFGGLRHGVMCMQRVAIDLCLLFEQGVLPEEPCE